jgi:hypothetical protein
VWDATVYCKNRDRPLDGDNAGKFMSNVLNSPQMRGPLSSEHFSIEGTLIEAWASMKSFLLKDGGKAPLSGKGRASRGGGRNIERNFRGEKRNNATHASMTEPDAPPFRKAVGILLMVIVNRTDVPWTLGAWRNTFIY